MQKQELSLFVLLTFGGVCLVIFFPLLMAQIKLYGQVYEHPTKPMAEHYIYLISIYIFTLYF